jgi:hypothetical protein
VASQFWAVGVQRWAQQLPFPVTPQTPDMHWVSAVQASPADSVATVVDPVVPPEV